MIRRTTSPTIHEHERERHGDWDAEGTKEHIRGSKEVKMGRTTSPTVHEPEKEPHGDGDEERTKEDT